MSSRTREREHPRTDHITSIPRDVAERVASTDCSVLVTGETGVGKGYFACWLHEHGCRAAGPFIPVNCGALPEGIIDSHLFGHARGAFSDAHADHVGLVRAAAGGTLFLDEVSELPMIAQRRLLRLLEEREVQPVGATAPVSVDVRVVAAAGRDLHDLVEQGAFREDLYYRLNIIQLSLKPLRERPDDVPRLVEAFGAEFAARLGRAPLRFRPAALRMLVGHPWPGNVRQLRTVVERLHVLCPTATVGVEEVVTCGQLVAPEEKPRSASPSERLRPSMREARIAAVRRALDVCGGNVSRAATTLGVHRSTIHRWLATDRLPA